MAKSTDKLIFDLEMLQIDYNEQKIEALKKEISNKYNVPLKNIEINFKPISIDKNGEEISLTSDIIDNIQKPEFQIELFKEYLKLKNINDIDFDSIKDIDAQVNSYIDFDSYSKYKSYKFKYVKWDNYLSYGKGNYFDFTKLNGLVLLNGMPENQCGKTTFAIDLLRFALFGKAQKSPTLDSVFNVYLPEETNVLVEAGIEIGGIDYIIRRTVTRPVLSKRTAKSKCKQTVEYFKVVGDNFELIENCEGESSTQTNNIIKESVGTVEDFNLVISATAYTLSDLLHMGQSDKGKLFSKWLGLLSIEKKEEIAKDIWKKQINTNLMSNLYNKETLSNEIEDYKVCISSNEKKIKDCESLQNSSILNINSANEEKIELLKKTRPIKDNVINTDMTTVENNISTLETELNAKRSQMKQMKSEYIEVKDITFNNSDLENKLNEKEERQKEINKLNEENAELRTKIGFIRNDNKRIKKLIDDKICPHCGQEISVTQQNNLIIENNNKENELIIQGKNNKNKIDSISFNISEIEKEISKLMNDKELLHNKQKLELKMTAVKTNIDNIKLQIQNLIDIKNSIIENIDNIKFNNELQLSINTVDVVIKKETEIKETQIREIQKFKNEIEQYTQEIDKRSKLLIKLSDEEKLIRNWNVYQELIGKNGIVKIILRKALPIINNEISRILDGLCDFKVILTISDDNKICIDMYREGKKLDLGTCSSGFEGTFASLAIRSALASIATMAKPNFLTLDEIDATIAVSNYGNLTELYRRILNNYQFILHIAHNEQLESIHDMTITVYKENNISKLMIK